MSSLASFLGSGIIRPFQRDGKGDFANQKGADLIRATIGQILGTRASSAVAQGELPWDPDRGSLLYTIRHRNNDHISRERARIFAQDAVRKHDKRVQIIDIEVIEQERVDDLNQMVLLVTWSIVDRNHPNNAVLLGPETTEVPLV